MIERLVRLSNDIQAAIALGYGTMSEEQEAALIEMLMDIDILLQEAGLAAVR